MAAIGTTTEESTHVGEHQTQMYHIVYRGKYYRCNEYGMGARFEVFQSVYCEKHGFIWEFIRPGSPIFKQVVAKVKKDQIKRPQIARIKITLHLKNEVETKFAYRYKRKRSNHKKKINKRRIKDAW